MTNALVASYEKGAITADHLVVQCLSRINPENPSTVLDDLPIEILDRMKAYLANDRPDRMVSNYPDRPTLDQVEAARRWIGPATRNLPLASSGT